MRDSRQFATGQAGNQHRYHDRHMRSPTRRASPDQSTSPASCRLTQPRSTNPIGWEILIDRSDPRVNVEFLMVGMRYYPAEAASARSTTTTMSAHPSGILTPEQCNAVWMTTGDAAAQTDVASENAAQADDIAQIDTNADGTIDRTNSPPPAQKASCACRQDLAAEKRHDAFMFARTCIRRRSVNNAKRSFRSDAGDKTEALAPALGCIKRVSIHPETSFVDCDQQRRILPRHSGDDHVRLNASIALSMLRSTGYCHPGRRSPDASR